MNKPVATHLAVVLFLVMVVLVVPGCDLLSVSQTGRNIREGNAAVQRGEFQRAEQFYEAALDGTMLSAEAHYRLGLLYEDHLKNQVAALYHFERYLELAPQGQFAEEVKGYAQRLRLVIVSSLADGTVLPAREASRLKNENLELRQQIAELKQKLAGAANTTGKANSKQNAVEAAVAAAAAKEVARKSAAALPAATPLPLPANAVPQPEPEVRRAMPVTATVNGAAQTQPFATQAVSSATTTPQAVAPASAEPRSHTVVRGDTLAGISRKYYKKASDWQKIADANKDILSDPTKLQVGMVLKIP